MRCGIALGSNLGDRLKWLRGACRQLAALHQDQGAGPLRVSPLFQTDPVDCPEGSDFFFNAVAELEAGPGETPHGLLAKLQAIETALGRVRTGERNAPRTLDLDLLYFGGVLVESPDLRLPHPRLAERRFVLEPLASLSPELCLPGHEASVGGLLARLSAEPPLRRTHAAGWHLESD